MKRMLTVFGLMVAMTMGAAGQWRGHNRNETDGAPAGKFDIYLMNVSYEPAFCGSPAGRGKAECESGQRFTLHGLWPEYANGSWPAECVPAKPGPTDAAKYRDVYPDAELLAHEWEKHGTCSGLSADDYFSAARRAYTSLNLPMQFASGRPPYSMKPAEIIGMFASANPGVPKDAFRLSCASNWFSAIEVCLDRGLKPVSCPQIKTCGATSVRIDPPR